jgi:hypothetical protein
MSTAEMQACLARLYKHEAYRRLFYLDPDPALQEYGLTEEEANALKALDRRKLEAFALALRVKRGRKLRATFPILFKLYPARLTRHVNRYFELYPAHPEDSLRDEVRSFGAFLRASLATDEAFPPYAPDIVQYEKLYYLAKFLPVVPFAGHETPGRSADPEAISLSARPLLWPDIHIGSFRHDVPKYAAIISQRQIPLALTDPGEFCYVFQFTRTGAEPKLFRISPATGEFLHRCDGSSDIAELADRLTGEFGRRDIADELLQLVRKLVGADVLRV